MQLSVVIVNWNTTELLKVLLQSIEAHKPSFEYEVIVVDNASKDIDIDNFRESYPQVRLIANQTNTGYAKGNNQGIAQAKGDYILLLNPDTEITDDALGVLVRFMQNHAEVGAAGAKLIRPNGSVDHSVRSFPYPGPIAWEFLGLSRLFPRSKVFGAYRMNDFTYDKVKEVDQPMGSCLIISKTAIEEVGFLDEQFPIFFNEVDWLYRAKQAGYKIYFVPDAVVIHHGAGSTSQAGRSKMLDESHKSLVRFYSKHFKGKIFPPFYYFLIACIRAGRYLRG